MAEGEAARIPRPDVPTVVQAMVDRYSGHPVQPAPEDVYKLLYHAALGSEHAVGDPAGVDRWMRREVAELGPAPDGPAEMMVESLGPFVRVHLRPYLAAGGSPGTLLAAFIRTGSLRVPKESLHRALEAALAAARERVWPWSADELAAFFDAARERGDPAVHHSAAFAAAYRPAYRVVAAGEVPALLEALRR